MNYCFSYVGMRVVFDLPVDLEITYESSTFESEGFEDPDLTVRLTLVESISAPNKSAIYHKRNFYFSDDNLHEIHRCEYDERIPYARLSWDKDDPVQIECQCTNRKIAEFFHTSNLMNLIGLENILLFKSALLIHASFINVNGNGILFTAPSGTGKSTQAELWHRFENADIINGDRAGLRKSDGVWNAWGLPYAGSSGIYRNESAPIRAVVVLRQSKTNRIRKLSAAESLRYVYPEISIHRWDPNFVDKAVNLYLDLASLVPVYLLECLPDESAVCLLKETLLEGGALP